MELIFSIFQNNNLKYIILCFLFFLLGWLIRKVYKLFLFFRLKFFGKLGEEKARLLLIDNGFRILEKQLTVKGKLIENNNMISFYLKPDFLVEKNNKTYLAEVKTGKSASIKNIHTRRQLLEYSFSYNSKVLLLIDIDNNNIKEIEFYNI